MSNILLAGDSWGVGVFSGSGEDYGPIGKGIHSILEDHGHIVINISKAGGSNLLMIDRMNNEWNNTGRTKFGHSHDDEIVDINWKTIDYIVFLQTDIFRENYTYVKENANDTRTTWKKLDNKFVESLLAYDSIDSFIDHYFDIFYKELNTLALKYQKTVLMLGCWSQLHNSIHNYSNLVPVVQSATKLLIPEIEEDVYLSDPEWYTELSDHNEFMRRFGGEFKEMTISANQKLEAIYKNWNEVHPNIDGYNTLTDLVLKQIG